MRFWCCCFAFKQIVREFRFLITSREVSVCGSESNPFYRDALKCQPCDLCIGAPRPSQKSLPGFGSAFPDGNSVICTHQSLQIDLNRSFLDAVIHYHQTLVLRKVHSSGDFFRHNYVDNYVIAGVQTKMACTDKLFYAGVTHTGVNQNALLIYALPPFT